MAEAVAEIVARLAEEHGVEVDPSTRAYRLAKGGSHLAGIEGDETLDLLAELSRRGLVERRHAVDLIERHAKESGGDADFMQKRHIGKVKGGLVEWLLSFPALPGDLPDRRGTGPCMFDPREREMPTFDHRRSDIERTVSSFEGAATTVEQVGLWSCDAFEVWAVRSVRTGQVHLMTAPAVTMQEVYTHPETRMGVVPVAFLFQLRAEALEDLARLDDLIRKAEGQ